MLAIAVLLVAKFILYCGVCALAPRHLGARPASRVVFAMAWAACRLVLGLLATAPIFFLLGYVDKLGLPSLLNYFLLMTLVRSLLWWAIAKMIVVRHKQASPPRLPGWVLLGVCASFLVDGAATISGANFKFFC